MVNTDDLPIINQIGEVLENGISGGTTVLADCLMSVNNSSRKVSLCDVMAILDDHNRSLIIELLSTPYHSLDHNALEQCQNRAREIGF